MIYLNHLKESISREEALEILRSGRGRGTHPIVEIVGNWNSASISKRREVAHVKDRFRYGERYRSRFSVTFSKGDMFWSHFFNHSDVVREVEYLLDGDDAGSIMPEICREFQVFRISVEPRVDHQNEVFGYCAEAVLEVPPSHVSKDGETLRSLMGSTSDTILASVKSMANMVREHEIYRRDCEHFQVPPYKEPWWAIHDYDEE